MYTGLSAHMTSNHGWIKCFSIDFCFGEKPGDQKHFDGVYPRDILKSIKETPQMIIVNTDPSTKVGNIGYYCTLPKGREQKFLTLWVMMLHLIILP